MNRQDFSNIFNLNDKPIQLIKINYDIEKEKENDHMKFNDKYWNSHNGNNLTNNATPTCKCPRSFNNKNQIQIKNVLKPEIVDNLEEEIELSRNILFLKLLKKMTYSLIKYLVNNVGKVSTNILKLTKNKSKKRQDN